MGLSAMYRGLSLISGTLAGLPFRTWTGQDGGERKRVPSVFDDPDGPDGQTPFEWKETAFLHLLLHGRTGAIKQRNAAGGLARLALVHPLAFRPRLPSPDEIQRGGPAGGLWFDVALVDGTHTTLDAEDFWYVPAASMQGQLSTGLLDLAQRSVRTTIAAERAAARMFDKGALISGIATPADSEEQDLTDDVPEIRKQINRAVSGYDKAGTIAIIARRLKFTPWTMTGQQAQFLEQRQFQIEEISRWLGVPPHLLMQTEKQTSWGTGVDEQNRGLSKFVLNQWSQRFEERASRLLPAPRWVEFDFAGLERPNFATLVDLVIKQLDKRLISEDYARGLLNIPASAAPKDGGPQNDPTAP